MIPTIAESDYKLAIVMVGLPARGKTYCARNIARYLQWLGIASKCFSIADYRARHYCLGDGGDSCARAGSPPISVLTADYFDPRNAKAMAERAVFAEQALQDLLAFYREGGIVGLLDASHTQAERRAWLHATLAALGVQAIFLECISSGEEMEMLCRYVSELQTMSGWHKAMDAKVVVNDYAKRIAFYRETYQPIVDTDKVSYVKYIDGGARIEVNRSRVLFFLMSMHAGARAIYLCAHKILPGDVGAVWASPENDKLQHPVAEIVIKAALAKPGENEVERDLVLRLESVVMELEAARSSVAIVADPAVVRSIYRYFQPKMVETDAAVLKIEPRAYGIYETRLDSDLGPTSSSFLPHLA